MRRLKRISCIFLVFFLSFLSISCCPCDEKEPKEPKQEYDDPLYDPDWKPTWELPDWSTNKGDNYGSSR